jgi:hypothetical protein
MTVFARSVTRCLVIISALAASSARAADDDHVVNNVVNGYVYVSIGSRDGVAAGDHLEIVGDGGVAVGVLELDLCGEVICRAPLAKGLVGKVARGMLVRARKQKAAPVAEPDELETVPTKPIIARPKTKPVRPDEPLAGPDVMPYREPIPRGYQLDRKPYSGLVTLGWLGFSVTYGITTIVGLANGDDGMVLFLPVIGPLIYVATPAPYQEIESGGFILSTLLQGASVIALIAGYAGEKRLVRIGSKATVSFAPVVTRDGGYFGLVGSF